MGEITQTFEIAQAHAGPGKCQPPGVSFAAKSVVHRARRPFGSRSRLRLGVRFGAESRQNRACCSELELGELLVSCCALRFGETHATKRDFVWRLYLVPEPCGLLEARARITRTAVGELHPGADER